MDKILFVFITHQNNIEKTHRKVSSMMDILNNRNYIIVQGGCDRNTYDINSKILSLNCNDKYEGLPEKILKTYKYIIESDIFDQYTHIIKLDDDIIIRKSIDYNDIKDINYGGITQYNEGNRNWHRGKCSNTSRFNCNKYSGIFVPWCKGGYGYVISRISINLIKNDSTYKDVIYEDLYIAILLKEKNIHPKNIDDWKLFFISPDHK